MATEGQDIAYRNSQASSRSSGSGRRNPQQQLSQIEKSVTHLLVATKQLLETLTQWSRGNATEGEVSDVYVRLGYEFNIACRAFGAIGVETTDLGPVPELLRGILEDTLSQDANQQSLDKYLPRIRDIIINLLQGLKKKQSKLRAQTAKNGDVSMTAVAGPASRQSSIHSGPVQMPEAPTRQDGTSTGLVQASLRVGSDAVQRSSMRADGRGSLVVPESQASAQSENRLTQPPSSDDSTLSSNTAQTMPVIPPYPEYETMPGGQPEPPPHADDINSPQPPYPTPKQHDALLALQRGGDLERRASRRFSTYHLGKQLGGAANGLIPSMPPAQHSPIPNRGREVRESLHAVRSRGSQLYQRQRSERRLAGETSPVRNGTARLQDLNQDPPKPEPVPVIELPDSPLVKTPPDKLGKFELPVPEQSQRSISAPVAPIDNAPQPAENVPASNDALRSVSHMSRKHTGSPDTFVSEDSPQPGRPLTLFLQFKHKVKKYIIEDGSTDLSLGRIQLAFIDKFQWNTHMNGQDLPQIYIQDATSGVRYELEDLSDIKNNTVLVLNHEQLDELKQHFDEKISGLVQIVSDVRSELKAQNASIQLVTDRQQESAKEIASIAAAPVNRMSAVIQPTRSASGATTMAEVKLSTNQQGELQSLRRDLAVVRQTYSSFMSDVQASMSAIRTKAASVKATAVKVSLPDMKGGAGRAYVNKTLDELNKDQEKIVETVEEVQDLVEDLRKDVVTRGVRPLPRQLEQVAKDISNAMQEVKRMEARCNKDKPIWAKIWKEELQQVCDDRDMSQEAEALITDLKLDLDNADKTFRLVEEATKQQNIAGTAPNPAEGAIPPVNGAIFPRNLSSASRIAALNSNPNVSPQTAKDSMLGEVKGLRIDHEERLEAISRAEKARLKELESREDGALFKKELGSFVDEGKLKKTGGVDEVERMRKVREEKAKKEFSKGAEDDRKKAMEDRRAAMLAEREAIRKAEREAEGDEDDEDEEFEEASTAQADGEGHT